MSSFRDSFRRLLRPDAQSRSAKTVEVFGWLILIEGALILLAPGIVVSLLHLPALGEQGGHYFRLLGLFVGGVGMLYVVSGRMNAEGFVFASLLDRPLVPPAMALLWHFGIVPGPLAVAFAIQDFGSFLWTLRTWRAERQAAHAVLDPRQPLSDDLDGPGILAIQSIYSSAMLEELKAFQVVDKLGELFQAGTLPLGRGEGGRKLQTYGKDAARRLSESERRAVYQRALGMGSDGGVPSNRDFNPLWRRFVSAVVSSAGRGSEASQEELRKAGRDLAANLSLHGHGMAYVAATALRFHVRDMRELLSDMEIQRAFGARDLWQLIDRFAARELGGAANSARLRSLEASGTTVLRWLASKAERLAQGSATPLLDIGDIQRQVTDGPGAAGPPSDFDLVQAAEGWLAATGSDK